MACSVAAWNAGYSHYLGRVAMEIDVLKVHARATVWIGWFLPTGAGVSSVRAGLTWAELPPHTGRGRRGRPVCGGERGRVARGRWGQLDPAMAANDSILPFYIMQQLPVGVAGLVIAAIFAASQSTVSSSLNSVATAFIKDVDARLLRPGRDDRTYLRAAQGAVVVAGSFSIAVAVWMAESSLESAFKTFNILTGLTAGSLGGLFALRVSTRRAHGTGALQGAFLGLEVVLGLRFSGAPVTGLLYGFIGFGVCFGAG